MDVLQLPDEVREKLAELELELSEGKKNFWWAIDLNWENRKALKSFNPSSNP